MSERVPCIWVLAGTNGAGKSSIGGSMLRRSGGEYFNPDEAARKLIRDNPALEQKQANSLAWQIGVRQLRRAIHERHEYFFETTLGGRTIPSILRRALEVGMEVRVWYVGLRDAAMHVERVAARVAGGGHGIPTDVIRRRFDGSRRNLVELLPLLTEVEVYDNSAPADLVRGIAPKPRLLLHLRHGEIVGPKNLRQTPDWAKPIVAQALKLAGGVQ